LELAIGLINKAIGRLQAETSDVSESSDDRPIEETIQTPSTKVEGDPRKVFVVHGRNEKAREAMFVFLRSIGLEPIEWLEAVKLTGKASPYIGEILDEAFSYAKAIVVLLTGDDVARLGTRFTEEGKPNEKPAAQARPNVIFEAGLAFGRNPDRTIMVKLGELRDISDVAGRHIIRMDNTIQCRQGLVSRLRTAGCDVQWEARTDWHNAGDFDDAVVSPDR
jgi:predicted nucleotide-binding protein